MPDKFKDEWLDTIRTYQSHLIPIEEVENENVKKWFEHLPASPAYDSKYRCWLCHEYSDIFDVKIISKKSFNYVAQHNESEKNT